MKGNVHIVINEMPKGAASPDAEAERILRGECCGNCLDSKLSESQMFGSKVRFLFCRLHDVQNDLTGGNNWCPHWKAKR